MLLLSRSIGTVRSLPVNSRASGIRRWYLSQSSVTKVMPFVPVLSRSLRQVASSRRPKTQATVRPLKGS